MAKAFYWNVIKKYIKEPGFRHHFWEEIWGIVSDKLPGRLVTPRTNYIYCRDSNPAVPGGRWLPPQSLAWRPAAYGLLFDKAGNVLMVCNNTLNFYWNFPGGGISRGETQEHALVREFREETGLEVEIGPIVDSWDDFLIMPTGQPVHGVLHFYLVKAIGGTLSPTGNGFDVGQVEFFENYFEPGKPQVYKTFYTSKMKEMVEKGRERCRTLNYDCNYDPSP